MMKHPIWILMAIVVIGLAGCGDDSIVEPPDVLAPPTNVTVVTGDSEIVLNWDNSPDAGADVFEGYNVYIDTLSIAGLSDSTSAAFLNARRVNQEPMRTRTYTVLSLASGASLEQGKKYYLHVRSERSNGRVSVASNEVDTSPRPEGTNEGTALTDLMFDYSANTNTRSGYGWVRDSGAGQPHVTSQANAEKIDFFMTEEPNSANDGSVFVSPAQANFTQGWSVRNRTLFKDLGAGDAAWQTSTAPDTTDMTESVPVVQGHTYALYTHDGYWVKVRVTNLTKNVSVAATGGGTVRLNRAQFDYAFQLIRDYGRFKPGTGF